MIVFVNGVSKSDIEEHAGSIHLGVFVGPRNWNDLTRISNLGFPWAADNDCFNGLDPDSYLSMLDRIAAVDLTNFVFVTTPDVVADHRATATLFRGWLPALKKRRLPIAFVAQDGATADEIPWNDINALFVGGSTRWKLSRHAARLMAWGKKRDKWVHVGRVNSKRREDRIGALLELGADSFDGTQYSMFRRRYLSGVLRRLASPRQIGIREIHLYA